MPYAANVINVMIASPSDVEAERHIARDVLDEWNRMNAERSGLVLMALGWETHSAPELGDRPQGIINTTILARADILVAVFHNRLGTPTGEAESGTVEEIERHVAQGKLAMLYFSDVPTKPSEIDEEQRGKVSRFRKAMLSRGLVEGYDARPAFEEKLRRQLNEQVQKRFGNLSRGGAAQVPEPKSEQLDEVAATLLCVAAKEGGGIGFRDLYGGVGTIAAGDQIMNEFENVRSTVKWKAAIGTLERYGLIERTDFEGHFWEVTHEGYKHADRFTAAGFQSLPSEYKGDGGVQ